MSLNLSKINLTKENPTTTVARNSIHQTIEVNLQWSQKQPAKGLLAWIKNLFGFGEKTTDIDLDLGAFVRLQDNSKHIVQALGNSFGSFIDEPHVMLLGDDRTGSSTDGEWLRINGKYWDEIKEVYIYAFIYDGVPNWAKTDGVVTVHVPGSDPIEVKLEGESSRNLCVAVKLENQAGTIKASRLDTYHHGQSAADDTYGWGLNWVKGRK